MSSPDSRARRDRWVSLVAVVATIAIFVLDVRTPLGVTVSSLYVFVVLLGLSSSDCQFELKAAIVCSVLIVLDLPLSGPGGSIAMAMRNKPLDLVALWIASFLVTRYRVMEARLRRETQASQEYLDVVGVVVVALDLAGRVTLINRKGREILDRPESEILGRLWTETFVPSPARAETRRVFSDILANRLDAAESFEAPVVSRTGEQRLLVWNTQLLRDDAGRLVGTLSSGTDITARTAAVEALRRSLKDLADIKYALDQSSILATTDRRGIINYVNDKFCEISKYSREELLGQDHRIINSGHHPKEFFRDMWRTIGSGGIFHAEIKNRAKDGTYYWVDTTIVPFLDETGRPYQYTAIRNDITARKMMEAELLEKASLARLGQMAAVVAHEVKNPLAGLRGALEILRGRLPADATESRVIGEMLLRIDSLNRMVQDLLIFANPTPPQLSSVSLGGLLKGTAAMLGQDPTFGGIHVEISGQDATVPGDANMLRGVFLNLLLNAAQAMNLEGTIGVAIANGDRRCEVRIADQGPGISAELRERIFEPFFTTKHRGSGLGLAIARRTVELHAGSIALESPESGGTVVTVILPVAPSA